MVASHTPTEDVTLAQVYELLHREHDWSEDRFRELADRLTAGLHGVHGAVADVRVQVSGLAEHAEAVDRLSGDVAALRTEVRRRQILWTGGGFVSGLAAAVAAVKAFVDRGGT